MNKRIYCLFLLLLFLSGLYGQNITVKGIVTDSITGEALPYAELLFKEVHWGPQQMIRDSFP